MALSALLMSFFLITTEILSSDEPWAVATTLMPFLPKTENSFPEVPEVDFMPSPTTAIIDRFCWMLIFSISPLWISVLKPCSSISCTFSEDFGSIAKHIECSEEAWEIRITEILFSAKIPKSFAETPATPIIPLP